MLYIIFCYYFAIFLGGVGGTQPAFSGEIPERNTAQDMCAIVRKSILVIDLENSQLYFY